MSRAFNEEERAISPPWLYKKSQHVIAGQWSGSEVKYTYTPAVGFTGFDAFAYRDRDAAGSLSAPVTVTITLRGPVAFPDAFDATAFAPPVLLQRIVDLRS